MTQRGQNYLPNKQTEREQDNEREEERGRAGADKQQLENKQQCNKMKLQLILKGATDLRAAANCVGLVSSGVSTYRASAQAMGLSSMGRLPCLPCLDDQSELSNLIDRREQRDRHALYTIYVCLVCVCVLRRFLVIVPYSLVLSGSLLRQQHSYRPLSVISTLPCPSPCPKQVKATQSNLSHDHETCSIY